MNGVCNRKFFFLAPPPWALGRGQKVKYHIISITKFLFCLFVFVALRPMSTAMVIAGRSVHLTTLFPGQA